MATTRRSKSPAKKVTKTPQLSVKTSIKPKKELRKTADVFLYVPQFVGYSRVLSTLLSMYYMTLSLTSGTHYLLAINLYLYSFIGDLFDGMAARKFNQSSKFGGVLDMVTDRCTTAGMLVVLSWIYVNEGMKLMFLGLFFLDISSHWMQMTSSLMIGEHHKSKEGNAKRFFLVRLFYENYAFFGYCCVGAELTYVLLYILAYLPSSPTKIYTEYALYYVCTPACVCKNIVNLAQLASASWVIAEEDVRVFNKGQ
ncbi:hypothetical protein TL16_g12156, partial [Triparma laevis f. inornata]